MEIFNEKKWRAPVGEGGTPEGRRMKDGAGKQGGAVLAVQAGDGRMRMVGLFTAGAWLAGGAHISPGKAGRRGAAGAGHTGDGMPEI